MIDSAAVLDAVGEPNRRHLLELLHRRRESTVNDLVEASGLRQPQVSKHLKVLAGAALVSARADGRHRHYRLDGRGLQAAHDWFASFEDVWHARFDALDQLVSSDLPREHLDPAPSDRLIEDPGTDIADTSITDTDIPDTDIPGTEIPGTDIPDTDITGTDITGTDITGTDFTGTDIPDNDITQEQHR